MAEGQMLKKQTMSQQKVQAYISIAQKSDTFWAGIVIFLGALMLLSSFPFYPAYVVFILAAICALIAIKSPPFGVLAGVILAFPTIVYQSSVFGWFYILIMVLVMFEAFEDWLIIASLEIIALAPFAFGGFPFAGYISLIGMAVAALHFGSRKSLAISLSSVAIILLLSSIWLVPNTAYMPIKMSVYQPGRTDLMLTRPVVDIANLPKELNDAVARFLSWNNLSTINDSFGTIIGDIQNLALKDSLILQVIGWGIALFLLGFLPAQIKKHSQSLASLSLLILIPVYYLVSMVYGVPFMLEFAAGIVISIAVLCGLEYLNINISRESEITRAEKMKSYGKFGMTDISLSGEEKSMNDVGGYEDVKTELRDAIMMPLEKKEIAFTYGIKPPAGILLFGPPGTGKTMLMRSLAKELKYNFIEVRCSQILSQWYGESLPADEKLVVKDTDGTIKRMEIGRIVEEKRKVKVLSFNHAGKAVFADIKDWIKHKATSPIYEVRTRTGRRIRVTDYHSLFAFDGMKLDSVPTAELRPGTSYIAVPRKIAFNPDPVTSIDFYGSLEDDDYGMYVKNPGPYLTRAIANLGLKRASRILGYKSEGYLYQVIEKEVGVRVLSFKKLMKEAGIAIDGEKILIGAGCKTLPGRIMVDERLSTFIGLWVAEGSYNRMDTLRISTSEKELPKIAGLCRELFGKITIYEKKGSKGRDIYIPSRPLYVLFRRVLGLEDGAVKKKMPDIAFNLDRKNTAAVLRGYFSGDGSIYENQRGVGMVEGCTVSRELADQLMHLLLYFGIIATVYGKKEWSGTDSYRVIMCGGRLLSQFREIGFLDTGKMSRMDKSIASVKWFREEQVPIGNKLRSYLEMNLPKWAGSSTIGRGQLDIEDEELDYFSGDEKDIYFDRVEEIKKVSDERYVYDVSVDPCQNFVAGFGGIFAHNSEKNVQEVFQNARKNAPTVLFFDEIDSVAKKRSTMGESLDTVGPRVLSELLQQMDGASKAKGTVMVVGATNLPNELDPAILRPGRLDKIIYMHLPDPEARRAIFKLGLKKLPIGDDVNIDTLVKKTDRFSGADIKNIVTEAKGLAAREASVKGEIVPLSMAHFNQILDNVKPSTSISQLENYEQFRLDFERRSGGAKPKEEAKVEAKTELGWKDVAGLDEVKDALLEAIELPLLHEEEMKKFNVRPSKGILLFGPPGTGKTLIVRAAANELKSSFQTLSAADVMKKGYTEAVNIIKETFNRARENSPAIIFIDEIETFAPARSMGGSAELIGQFLTEMDGVKGLKGVVVLAATNKPELMDPAIMRPGRFDKIFYIPPPDENGRKEIFKIHLGEFAGKVDLGKVAVVTKDYSGADIAEVCRTVKMKALKDQIAGRPVSIDTNSVMDVIKTRRPSITQWMIAEYQKFLQAYGERK